MVSVYRTEKLELSWPNKRKTKVNLSCMHIILEFLFLILLHSSKYCMYTICDITTYYASLNMQLIHLLEYIYYKITQADFLFVLNISQKCLNSFHALVTSNSVPSVTNTCPACHSDEGLPIKNILKDNIFSYAYVIT